MRAVCYLGTRGCPGVLEEALREDLDPLTVLVPLEARLLGPLAEDELADGIPEVAEILVDRARRRAVDHARRRIDEQAGVFGATADPAEIVAAETLAGPLDEALPTWLDRADAGTCYVSRDAMDVLAQAEVPVTEALDAMDVTLVTR